MSEDHSLIEESFLYPMGPRYESWERERKLKLDEAKRQSALLFIKHFKKLSKGKDTLQISLEQLYKGLEYKTSVWILSSSHPIPKPHECAQQYGMVKINESTRPYIYSLMDTSSSNAITLRPYQEEIITQATAFEGSVLIEAPTGSGKSVMACDIAKKETDKGGKVLIVAPKIILLEQLKETFIELNPQIIHGPADYDTQHNVFISTIQTAHKRELGFEPTMILIDEVHFGFSGKMIKELLKDFTGRLIGLSATPYDQDGNPLSGFGLHINQFDLRYMLLNGFLVFPQCYAPVKVDLNNISVVAGDYSLSDLDMVFNNLESVLQIVHSTKKMILERKATLIFCINIAHAEVMAKAFCDNGVPTKAIHSKLTKEEQDSIMREYKSGAIKMLANPMMLTTGFDDPATDCIVLARPTRSQNLYRQMIGRALRLYKGKSDAMILDCGGVINDLGLPTQPIKAVVHSLTKQKHLCKNCESEQIFRKIIKNKPFWVCGDCGNEKEIESTGVECASCGLIHSTKAKYETREDRLYLICDECDYETLVSKNSSQEEMKAIFDEKYIQAIQTKASLVYITDLMENKGPDFILNSEVISHIKAFQNYIAKHPEHFLKATVRDILKIEEFNRSRQTEMNIDSSYYLKWYDPLGWRLFGIQFENELLHAGVNNLNTNLRLSSSLSESFSIIKKIHEETGKETYEKALIEQILREVSASKLKNIDSMANKRLKDLYFKQEDINQMKGFVGIIESVFEQ